MSKIRLYGSTSGYVDLAAPAVADDATLTLPTGAAGFGKVLQVVQTVKSDRQTTSTSEAAEYAVTGLTASITPSFASSKILVTVNVTVAGGSGSVGVYAKRDGALIGVGDAVSSAQRVSGNANITNVDRSASTATCVYLDSPASTSSLSYDVYFRSFVNGGGTVRINSIQDARTTNLGFTSTSSITLMEIGA